MCSIPDDMLSIPDGTCVACSTGGGGRGGAGEARLLKLVGTVLNPSIRVLVFALYLSVFTCVSRCDNHSYVYTDIWPGFCVQITISSPNPCGPLSHETHVTSEDDSQLAVLGQIASMSGRSGSNITGSSRVRGLFTGRSDWNSSTRGNLRSFTCKI